MKVEVAEGRPDSVQSGRGDAGGEGRTIRAEVYIREGLRY